MFPARKIGLLDPLVGLGVWLLCVSISQAFADPSQTCLIAFKNFAPVQYDSSVELEITMSPQLMKNLTTTDGKIRGMWLPHVPFPAWLETLARYRFGRDGDPLELSWEQLTYSEKMKALQTVSKARGVDFMSNRRVHGLKVKNRLELTFVKPTTFLGVDYPAGTHTIDVEKILSGPIEFRGPEEVEKVSGIELHFRGRSASGALSNDAWTFLDGIGIKRNHQHVHIVGNLMSKIPASPEDRQIWVIERADFYRRANLAAEMFTIVENGGSIHRVETEKAVYFDALTPERLNGVADYLWNTSQGYALPIGNKFKFGWIGMRGMDKYDSPGLWGIEYRAISDKADPAKMREMLNALQYAMHTEDFGISKERLKTWMESKPDKSRNLGGFITSQYYNKPLDSLLENAPKQIKVIYDLTARSYVETSEKNRREIKMLLHDWSHDSVLFDRPDRKAAVLRAQVSALQDIREGTPTNEAVRNFLLKSGLYQDLLESIGVQRKPTN